VFLRKSVFLKPSFTKGRKIISTPNVHWKLCELRTDKLKYGFSLVYLNFLCYCRFCTW
jgi:hypothetical protein